MNFVIDSSLCLYLVLNLNRSVIFNDFSPHLLVGREFSLIYYHSFTGTTLVMRFPTAGGH